MNCQQKLVALSKENEELRSDLFHAANSASLTERDRILKKYKIKTNRRTGRPKGSKKYTDQQQIEFYLEIERGRKSWSPPVSPRFFIRCHIYPTGAYDEELKQYKPMAARYSSLRTTQARYEVGKNLYSAKKDVQKKDT